MENPFQHLEAQMGQPEQKKQIAQALRQFELSQTMQADQFSRFHTEGPKVSDHYRLIFNAINAIRQGDEQAMARLPEAVRNAMENLDPSVAETIQTYPNVVRAMVLLHDVAKKQEFRTINITGMKEVDASAFTPEAQSMLEELKKIKEESKAAGKIKDRAEKQAKKDELEAKSRETYDTLKQELGKTDQEMVEEFGIGIGFMGHETRSAEMVEQMDLPEEIKPMLVKIVRDHLKFLNAFEEQSFIKEKNKWGDSRGPGSPYAKVYKNTFKDYSGGEFRLAAAMAALDSLGSVPESGEINLEIINDMIRGREDAKREAFIQEKIDALLKDEIEKAKEADPDLAGVDIKATKDVELKKKFGQLQKQVKDQLWERFAAEYEAQA